MPMGQKKDDNLIWVDLEMSGLDPNHDKILEIATIVTDSHLNTLAEGPVLVIHQPNEVLHTMDDWNHDHHTKTGLIDKVKSSTVTEAQAQEQTLDFLKQYLPFGASPMCGNSICQDRRFLYQHMPKLEEFFHYRNVDVSTIKELVRRWKPSVLDLVKKAGKHVALDDIKDSIAELQLYRKEVFQF